MKKGNTKNILTIVLVLLACCSVVLAFVMKDKLNSTDTTTTTISQNGNNAKIESKTVVSMDYSKPILKSSIDGYSYSVATDGKVSFYKYADNALTEVTDVKAINVSAVLSDQTISSTVYYINIDGNLCGYGIFTPSADSASVNIYSYVLFHLTNLPSAFSGSGKAFLLVNTDKKSIYSNSILWEDSFILNLSNGSTSRFLTENNRGVDITGARKKDFCVMTDYTSSVNSPYVLFFSSKEYQADSEGNIKIDIFKKDGSSESRFITDILDYYVKIVDSGVIYLQKTDTGFDVKLHSNAKNVVDSIIKSFTGTYGENFARSGDYLLDKENGIIYYIPDGSSRILTNYTISAMNFNISANGNVVLLTGTVANALEYGIYVGDLSANTASLYISNDFATLFNPRFLTDSEFTYTTVNGDAFKTIVAKN